MRARRRANTHEPIAFRARPCETAVVFLGELVFKDAPAAAREGKAPSAGRSADKRNKPELTHVPPPAKRHAIAGRELAHSNKPHL